MAATYGPRAVEIWTQALMLPGHESLIESLAFEVATFLDRPAAGMESVLAEAWRGRTDRMADSLPKGLAANDLVTYYGADADGLLTSAYWHSLIPDRYVLHSVSGMQCLQHFVDGNDVFEFGHGIGSTAVLLASNGFNVSAGDISETYRAFARQRAEVRGLPISLTDLLVRTPDPESFDAIGEL